MENSPFNSRHINSAPTPAIHQKCKKRHTKNTSLRKRQRNIFFPRTFLTAECFGPGTILLVSLQALDPMLTIHIPAAPGCEQKRAKSKPVSLQKGWKSAVVGGAGAFCCFLRNRYMEQKLWQHCTRQSHRAAFLATISRAPKALYLQHI